MASDSQDRAEALDEDVIDRHDDGSTEDYDGDEFGEGLVDYPPDRPLGVDDADDVEDSLVERVAREEPERPARHARVADEVGELVDPAGPVDHEERLIADETDSDDLSPEEPAMHLEPE